MAFSTWFPKLSQTDYNLATFPKDRLAMSVASEEGTDLRRRQQQSQQLGDAGNDDSFAATQAASPSAQKSGGDGVDGFSNTVSKDADMASLLDDDDDDDEGPRRPSDRNNIIVLLFLYVLQGWGSDCFSPV